MIIYYDVTYNIVLLVGVTYDTVCGKNPDELEESSESLHCMLVQSAAL